MSNPQYLAQVGHFLGGALIITIAAAFSFILGEGWKPVLITLAIGILAASGKEFVFDTSSWGEGDSWSDSLMDWTFYMLGAGVGMSVAAFMHHLLTLHCHCT